MMLHVANHNVKYGLHIKW